MVERTCSVEICDEPPYGRGWCKAHHQRWLTKGDPGTTPIRKKKPGSVCSVGECCRPHYAQFLCKSHYGRLNSGQDVGTAEFVVHPVPLEALTYHALHKRIAAARGAASDHACRCGARAAHWAYQHNDPNPQRDEETGLFYSSDIFASYAPMCIRCHIRLDRRVDRTVGAFW